MEAVTCQVAVLSACASCAAVTARALLVLASDERQDTLLVRAIILRDVG